MNSSVKFDYSEIKEFEKAVKTFGEKTALNAAKKAAQKASNIVGKSIRSAAPVGETGQLKRGFKKRKDNSKNKGVYVYHYSMSASMNEVFQKPIKEPGKYGGKSKSGYYPASVEYGFLTSKKGGGYQYNDGGKHASRKTEGSHFIEQATERVRSQTVETMKDVLKQEIDKEWAKK